MDLLTLENENAIQPAHLNQIHHEMDKMIDALIEPQMAEIIQVLCSKLIIKKYICKSN
jgi:hypothetical protein